MIPLHFGHTIQKMNVHLIFNDCFSLDHSFSNRPFRAKSPTLSTQLLSGEVAKNAIKCQCFSCNITALAVFRLA